MAKYFHTVIFNTEITPPSVFDQFLQDKAHSRPAPNKISFAAQTHAELLEKLAISMSLDAKYLHPRPCMFKEACTASPCSSYHNFCKFGAKCNKQETCQFEHPKKKNVPITQPPPKQQHLANMAHPATSVRHAPTCTPLCQAIL